MPLGLTNMPITIQDFINFIYADSLDDFLSIYLDNLLLYSASKSEHLAHFQIVFEFLHAHSYSSRSLNIPLLSQKLSFLGTLLVRVR